MSRTILGLSILLATLPAVAQEAPFCAVTAMGARCHFYSLQACWQAVQGLDGQCVANPANMLPQAQPAPAQPYRFPAQTVATPNVAGSFIAGMQAGPANRAPAQAPPHTSWEQVSANLEATCSLCPSKPAYRVLYLCPSNSGQAFTSETPLIGCTVADIER